MNDKLLNKIKAVAYLHALHIKNTCKIYNEELCTITINNLVFDIESGYLTQQDLNDMIKEYKQLQKEFLQK